MKHEDMNTTNPTSTRPQPADENPAPEPERRPKKFDLSVTQTVGGALAAMTAAALGSRLGVAGTITGAAVASIIAGVGGTLYTASLRTTREKVKTVWSGRVAGSDSTAGTKASVDLVPATPVWDSVEAATAPVRPAAPAAAAKKLPWKGMVVAVLTMFVIAAAALTTFEALSGSALSGGKGTTFSQVTKEHKPAAKSTKKAKASASPSPSDSPSVSASASDSPSAEATSQAPSDPATSAGTAPTSDQPKASEAPSDSAQNKAEGSGSGNSGSSGAPKASSTASAQDTPAG